MIIKEYLIREKRQSQKGTFDLFEIAEFMPETSIPLRYGLIYASQRRSFISCMLCGQETRRCPHIAISCLWTRQDRPDMTCYFMTNNRHIGYWAKGRAIVTGHLSRYLR